MRSAQKLRATKPATASIRDFGGGWNVADAEYNLSSRFLPVADNIDIDIDNSIGPRPGYKYDYDFRDGTTTAPVNITNNIITNTNGWISLTIPAHGIATGRHITISGLTGSPIGGVPVEEINGLHGVLSVDANTIRIQTRTTPTSNVTVSKSYTYTTDNHTLAGNIIEAAYFQNYIIAMDDIGEIARVQQYTGVKSAIWTIGLAFGTAGTPRGWGPTKQYSFDTWRQTLIVVNGRTNDKPIEIDNTRATPTQYLVDPATSSNSFVYPADFVLTHGNYLLLVGANNPNTPSNNTPTLVEISAEGTSGVFTGNPAPDDAVQIDLGKVTSTVDPVITGVNSIRDNVFIAFRDTAMLGKLGIYEGTAHKPDFKDSIPQHGSINHRVIRNVGNDLFMCDYAGVPAFTQSVQSGSIVPERLSQLIDPALVAHLARLGEDSQRYKVWGLFNVRDRRYMVFMPKFDEFSAFTTSDDIFTTSELLPYSIVMVRAPNHNLTPGDFVTVSSATGFAGLNAGDINGTRQVVAVVDETTFMMKVGAIPTVPGQRGGGPAAFAPINDENIGYIYHFNPALKIRRWVRYRSLKFDCGCVSRDGTVFFFRNGRVFSWGTSDKNYAADAIGEWDWIWAASTAYSVGERVKQSSGAQDVYICIKAYTSSGTFATNVEGNSENWEPYVGYPITWTGETPWSDYGKRMMKKINKYLQVDTVGRGRFDITSFVDNIYRDVVTRELSPLEEIDYSTEVVNQEFVCSGTGGFGAASNQNFGLGLRTREQHNFEYPFECRFVKLSFHGETVEPMKVIGISLLYHSGSIYR
jgi:hypothetical protein